MDGTTNDQDGMDADAFVVNCMIVVISADICLLTMLFFVQFVAAKTNCQYQGLSPNGPAKGCKSGQSNEATDTKLHQIQD